MNSPSHLSEAARIATNKYMITNTGMTEDEVTREIERYAVWPGQATAYKTGQLAILDLRTMAEAQLGDRFDLRAFHELVLMNGAMPLSLLREQVEAWTETQASL